MKQEINGTEYEIGPCANLEGANLEGANLYRANLYRANLYRANLYRANLEGANLEGADLRDANLEGADLYRADLYRADLYRADLYRADLYRTNLYRANLRGANLRGANLEGANLEGANLEDIKHDVWAIFAEYPHEVAGVQQALAEGRINGSVYSGDCACLIGTIANLKHCPHEALTVVANPDRPAEKWFLGIKVGDTPENHPVAAITNDWINAWFDLPVVKLALRTEQPQPAE